MNKRGLVSLALDHGEAMSFWEELKRRHVFKVGAAYAVTAWLLVQVADVVLPAFGLPNWVLQTVLALAPLGFLITVAVAWIYDLTPQGVRRTDDAGLKEPRTLPAGRKLDFAIIAVLVVALGVFVFENVLEIENDNASAQLAGSLAILPFANLNPDTEFAYLGDALANELISVLGGLRELRVAPRTSSFYFKDRNVDTATIASTLVVDNVLSGSVQREGNRVRINVTLDNVEGDAVLWTDTYDRTLVDILDVQSDIARSVAFAILPVLSPELQKRITARPTDNADAYDYYLRGLEYLGLPRERSTIASALELFERAIAGDSAFAAAHAGRCEALLGSFDISRTTESFEMAEVACQQALALEDSNWETQVALSNLYRINGQHEEAIGAAEAAILEHPTAVDAYLALAAAYSAQDRTESAEDTFLRAEEIESGYWLVHNMFGNFLSDNARYDEAITKYRRVVELTPDSGIGYDNLGNTYLSMGRLEESKRILSESPLPSRWTFMWRGLSHYYLGEFTDAIEDQERAIDLAPEYYRPWGHLGDAYRFLPGNEAKSRAAYGTAIELALGLLEINPEDMYTIADLCTYYAYTDQPDRAEALIERIADPENETGGLLYYAARAKMHLGDMETAYEYFKGTIEAGWSREIVLSDPDLIMHAGDERFERL